MIQLTLQEVMAWEVSPEAIGSRLYLVRDGETVFYIGQSTSPLDRLMSHLGQDWRRQSSDLGKLVHENLPHSLLWTVELSTLADGSVFVQQYHKTLPESLQAFWRQYGSLYDVDMAEQAMIHLYRPCLNVTYNPRPTPLPDKYTHARPNASSAQFLGV